MVTGVETLILNLREAGGMLVLLWLFTLAVTWGILTHLKLPNSMSARGTIAIITSFLVLLAAAGTQAASFVSTLVTSSIVILFGLLFVVIFFEVVGIKTEKHLFGAHPKAFSAVILVLLALIFVGAGGLGIVPLPAFTISSTLGALIFFLLVIVATLWVFVKEKKD